jgi:hypothetical protein
MVKVAKRQAVDRIVTAMSRTPVWRSVLGVRLGGSLGRGEGDESSDIDLFVVVADDDENRLLRLLPTIVAEVGPVRFYRGPVLVPGFGWSTSADTAVAGIVQFNVRSRGDWTPSYLQNQRSEILYDPHGIVERVLSNARSMEPEWMRLQEDSLSFIWFRALLVVKEAKRGNRWQSCKYFRQLLEQVITLGYVGHRLLPPGRNFREPGRAVEHAEAIGATRDLVLRADAGGGIDPVTALTGLIMDISGANESSELNAMPELADYWRRLQYRLREELSQ